MAITKRQQDLRKKLKKKSQFLLSNLLDTF